MALVVLILLGLAAALYVFALLRGRVDLTAVAGIITVVAVALPLLAALG